VLLNSLKSRMLLVLMLGLLLSHFLGLWLYARKHDEAASLLQDTLLAERIALVTHLLETTPQGEQEQLVKKLSSVLVKVQPGGTVGGGEWHIFESRPHLFEHLLGLFLNRPSHEGITSEHQPANRSDRRSLLSMLSAELNPAHRQLPERTLEDIVKIGQMKTEVQLTTGSSITVTNQWLGVSPFSIAQIWAPLGAVLIAVFLCGSWVIARATQPLTDLANAAARLGGDIRAAPLAISGATEVQSASRAFNAMQERIQRLVEDRTAFATALAHDIGTPITRLLLRLEELPPSDVKKDIERDITHMQRMVRATLDFARSDFNAERTEIVDVADLIGDIAAAMSLAHRRLSVRVPPGLTIQTRPTRLHRAISNIAENALKYGGEATIAARIFENPSRLEVRVEDRGPGIPKHLHEEAFRPFRRLVERSDASPSGTGLGLSIARSIARSLGGDVTLQNRQEGGLRATLSIPL
jgi:signal transduction histidine kinase